MRFLLLLPLLLLSACAVLAPDYTPVPLKIFDQAQYQADDKFCQAAGNGWVPAVSLRGAIFETVNGATSNTSMIPLSPLVPVFGAAGGAVHAASDGLNIGSTQKANVYRNCLDDFTRRDGSAIIAKPDQ